MSLLKRPELADKPVAVCHAKGTSGTASTSEVASVNYAARAFGLKVYIICPIDTPMPISTIYGRVVFLLLFLKFWVERHVSWCCASFMS